MNRQRFERLKAILQSGNYLVEPKKNIVINKITGRGIGRLDGKKKYIIVSLQHHGKDYSYSLHELVAFLVYGKKIIDKEVNHKDGDTLNNSIDNLEVVTAEENNIHQQENNILSRHLGNENPHSKLDESDIKYLLSSYTNFTGTKSSFCRDFSEQLGIKADTVKDIINRRRWKHISI